MAGSRSQEVASHGHQRKKPERSRSFLERTCGMLTDETAYAKLAAEVQHSASLKKRLAAVIEEKAMLEKEFMNHLTRLSRENNDAVKDLEDKLQWAQEALVQAEEEKLELLVQLEERESVRRHGMSIPQDLVDAISALRQHVDNTPSAIGALAHLDKQLSSLTVLRLLQPKVTLLTDDLTPEAFREPFPGVHLSRSTYPANDPSEDRSTVVCGDGFIFAGVWDGHGGTAASEYVQTHIFLNFKIAVDNGASIAEAFEFAYKKTDMDYLEYARALNDPAALFCGTCAVACYIDTKSGRVTCGNLGDSRAVMGVFENGHLLTVPLSVDHSAGCISEQERIRNDHPDDPEAVQDMRERSEDKPDWRVKKFCAFTRSLGDMQMKDKATATLFNSYMEPEDRIIPRPGVKFSPTGEMTRQYISNDPEIQEATVKDGFLIIGCDGVWDEMSSDEAVLLCAELYANNLGSGVNIAELFIEETLKKVVKRITATIYEEEGLTLTELKSRPLGSQDFSSRSSLHDDITVVILHFSSGGPHVYNATTVGNGILATTRDLFNNIDANGNGVLDIDELELLSEKLGKPLRGKELISSFNEMDADGDGHVDYREFETWWKTQRSIESTMKKRGSISDAISKLSEEIEKQKEDLVRRETNSQIVQMMEVFEGLSPTQLKILYDAVDKDDNGILDRDEVTRLVSKVLGAKLTPLLLETTFYEMDYDGSGVVDFDEFCDFFGLVETSFLTPTRSHSQP